VRVLEISLAVIFVLVGARSLWRWVRRPFESADPVDHALYAAFVTGRVGLWWSLAGLFALSASIEQRGRAAFEELGRYRPWFLVPLAFTALQVLASWFLGHRGPGGGMLDPRQPADPSADGHRRAEG
jgi:hypothetical protein